jgi:UDP-N-acetylglucosamine 2-epimerase (non-hydrolysing)
MSRAIALLVGTRPEAIKLAPVRRALERRGLRAEVYLTGQHRDLVRSALADLELEPVEDLRVMRKGQTLASLSARLIVELQGVLGRRRPAMLVVQGDTTSVLMSALAAFYQDVPVAHVEAGLRSGSLRNPFPEEMNRQLVTRLARLHFAPTPRARENLRQEGIPDSQIHVVGNTIVDALFDARDRLIPALPPDRRIDGLRRRRLLLVTAHRRESFGADLLALCHGLAGVARRYSSELDIVFPVHLNPNVQAAVGQALVGLPNVHLLKPLPYLRFLQLLIHAELVVTDSGGVQEECATLGKPLIVARRVTERPEALEAGAGELVPPEAGAIEVAARRLLDDPALRMARTKPSAIFGDGRAADRIADVLALGQT